MYPKVLVVSNNPFSKTNANGRTLSNLFKSWPKECIAQFYIRNEIVDKSVCENYFLIDESKVIKNIRLKSKKNNKQGQVSKIKRNEKSMLAREVVWSTRFWKTKKLKEWVKAFNPDIIFVDVSDSSFILKIALYFSKITHAKIVIHNCEDYYFKNYNYFKKTSNYNFLFRVYHKNLKNNYKALYKKASLCIYLTEDLLSLYSKEFQIKSDFIYNSSSIETKGSNANDDLYQDYKFSYCGNLFHSRYKTLIELGKSLYKINPSYKIDVYSNYDNPVIIEQLSNSEGINYIGFIKYEEVIEVLKTSSINIHIESFEEFHKKDLRYAFSTKIPDLLCVKKPILICGPETTSCIKYLLDNKAAHVVCKQEDLYSRLKEIIENSEIRNQYNEQSYKLFKKNHDPLINERKIYDLLTDLFG